MTAGLIGPIAVAAGILLALVAVVTGRWWALVAAAAAAGVATIVLGVALFTTDLSLAYVARTTSLATPWPYRVAALWGGMAGSMLFYSSLVVAVAAIGARTRARVRVGASVALGLLALTIAVANPFVVLTLPAVDGDGLLAILQHPAMIYHPPILYLGLVALIVPFTMVVAPGGGTDRMEWLAGVRRWLYVSWTLLTFGMLFGANWAYVELGWGGFWAWDPVENTSLMPWLAITVFLHSSRLEEKDGSLRRWNTFMAGLPFALSVMGVYLTRSGATGSIHSFAEDPVVGRVLLVATVLVLIVVSLRALRDERGQAWADIAMGPNLLWALNAGVLSIVLVFVVAGSAYPAFVSVFGGRPSIVDARFFVVTILPLAVIVAAGLSIALVARRVVYAVVALSMTGGLVGLLLIGPGLVLIAPATVALVVIVYSTVRTRPRGRLLVAHMAHLGMAILLIGVGASSFGDEFRGSMGTGDMVTVGGHEITLVGIASGEADRFVFVESTFSIDGRVVTPEIRAYEDQDTPISEPALRSTPLDDAIVAVSLLFPDGDTISVSVFVRPLVWWVWVGAALMGLGGLLALFGRDGVFAARRRSATKGRRREEATIDRTAR